jgi:hypothetical protein
MANRRLKGSSDKAKEFRKLKREGRISEEERTTEKQQI